MFSLLEYTLPDCTLLGFEAVFNATTNFIIDAMGTGRSYEDALAQVQAEGYAEADPSNDVDGWDAASKAAALANVAMDAGITPADVERESLRDVPLERILRAREHGRRLRLVSSVWREPPEPGRLRRPARTAALRPRPRPPARRGARHRPPAGRRRRRVARRAAPHRPHGRRARERAARARAADRLRRVRRPPPPVPDDLTGPRAAPDPAADSGAHRPPPAPPASQPARRTGPAPGRRAGRPGCAPRSSRSSSSPPAPPSARPATASSAPTPSGRRRSSGPATAGPSPAARPARVQRPGPERPAPHLAGRSVDRVRPPGRRDRPPAGPRPRDAHHLGPRDRRALRGLVRGRAPASIAAQAVAYDTQTRPALDASPTSAPSARTRRSPATSPSGAPPGDRRSRRSTACAWAAARAFRWRRAAAPRSSPAASSSGRRAGPDPFVAADLAGGTTWPVTAEPHRRQADRHRPGRTHPRLGPGHGRDRAAASSRPSAWTAAGRRRSPPACPASPAPPTTGRRSSGRSGSATRRSRRVRACLRRLSRDGPPPRRRPGLPRSPRWRAP